MVSMLPYQFSMRSGLVSAREASFIKKLLTFCWEFFGKHMTMMCSLPKLDMYKD